MGFFDRFKPKHEKLEPKKPRHVVVKPKDKAADEAKKTFQAVPAADRAGKVIERHEDRKAAESAAPAAAPKAHRTPEAVTAAMRTLLRPIITEKSSRILGYRQYVFEVNPNANKLEVKRAVETAYNVRPTAVQVLTVRGKYVRYGKTTGRTKTWKKAIVTLPVGKSITVYET